MSAALAIFDPFEPLAVLEANDLAANDNDASGALAHVLELAHGSDPETRSDYVKLGDMAIARVENKTTPFYSFSDHLGSPVAVWEQGGLIERERYTPFEITLDNPASLKNPAGFTGHIKDSVTGLNYMQARYYDPIMGRFLNIDPMTMMDANMHPGMFNRYAYTLNDPINLTDPTGMCSEDGKSGLCGDNQDFIDQQIANPDSIAGQTDAILQASGIRAEITEDQSAGIQGGCKSSSSCGANVPAHGPETVVEMADGSISTVRPQQDETFEHEVGHIFEDLTNPPSTDTVTTSSGTSYNDQIREDGGRTSPGHATTINRVNGYRRAMKRGYERVCSGCSEQQARDQKGP